MNTLNWNTTVEEAQHNFLLKLQERSKNKIQLEKEAKAEGRWDYRNNKIVDEEL